MRNIPGIVLFACLLACDGDGGTSSAGSATSSSGADETTHAADASGDVPTGDAATTATGTESADATGATGDGCGAKVIIAFYTDADCNAGSQKGQRAYNTAMDCFSWSANGSNATENSATRFQCYSDRLCYTQHPNSLTCEDGGFGATDKQAKNGECVKEPEGMLYSQIVGGNEGCPAPPPGFECPTSAAKMGTDGVVACMSQ